VVPSEYSGSSTIKTGRYLFIVFNATFSNISAISWRPVLMVEEPEYSEGTTDHGQAIGKLYHLRLRVECTHFFILQSRTRTHAVLVIGFYELFGNPTMRLPTFEISKLIPRDSCCSINCIPDYDLTDKDECKHSCNDLRSGKYIW
jgi:hypothetical protein